MELVIDVSLDEIMARTKGADDKNGFNQNSEVLIMGIAIEKASRMNTITEKQFDHNVEYSTKMKIEELESQKKVEITNVKTGFKNILNTVNQVKNNPKLLMNSKKELLAYIDNLFNQISTIKNAEQQADMIQVKLELSNIREDLKDALGLIEADAKKKTLATKENTKSPTQSDGEDEVIIEEVEDINPDAKDIPDINTTLTKIQNMIDGFKTELSESEKAKIKSEVTRDRLNTVSEVIIGGDINLQDIIVNNSIDHGKVNNSALSVITGKKTIKSENIATKNHNKTGITNFLKQFEGNQNGIIKVNQLKIPGIVDYSDPLDPNTSHALAVFEIKYDEKENIKSVKVKDSNGPKEYDIPIDILVATFMSGEILTNENDDFTQKYKI